MSPDTGGVPAWARPPRQARSRATLERLLAAAAELLAERRFEEATVQDLVRRAGSSVGAFYSRFPDKEALLQCFDERLFERGRQAWAEWLDPARWAGAGAGEIVDALVKELVRKRRANRGLLRALGLYVRGRPDPAFRARAARLNRFVTDGVKRLLLSRRGQIRHPEPARAVDLALFMVDAAIREAVLHDDIGLAPPLGPDARLERELSRAFRAYLGIPVPRAAPRRGR